MSKPRRNRIAFTLVEILVVVSVMLILMGMLTTVLGVAQRNAKQTRSRATMMKADHAVRMFRVEIGIYPHQTDLSTADVNPGDWTNNLGFRLAWSPDSAERSDYLGKMQADIDALHAKFVFHAGKDIGGKDGSHAFRFGDYYSPADANYLTNILMNPGSLTLPDAAFAAGGNAKEYIIPGWSVSGSGTAQVLTRMAEEITSLRYLAGQHPVEAPTGLDPADPVDKALRPNLDARYAMLHFYSPFIGATHKPNPGTNYTAYRYVPYNKPGAITDDSRGPALSTAEATARGWRCDYLSADLKRQTRPDGPGEISFSGDEILDAFGKPLVYVCPVSPGARGYTYAIGGTAIDESDYGMAPTGRDVTTSRASDIRFTAAQAYRLEFELWSKGRDGHFAEMRDAPGNIDNVAVQPYHKGLE